MSNPADTYLEERRGIGTPRPPKSPCPDKPTICVDFDGVIAEYTGWKGGLGDPASGVERFLSALSEHYNVVVLTTRKPTLIWGWLHTHDLNDYVVSVTSIKPLAVAYIDDRAIQFRGDFGETLQELADFHAYWEGE